MKNRVYILWFCLLWSSLLFSQQKIFFTVETSSASQRAFLQSHPEMSEMVMFYQPEFAPSEFLDSIALKKFINEKIPNINSCGYAVIDWEGDRELALNLQQNPQDFKLAEQQFLAALHIAKKMRPNMKWGFYGLPTANFWSPDDAWKNRNEKLFAIFREVDFIAPSLYLFYKPDESDPALTDRYLSANLTLALKIGIEYKKPVFPFIMHRYHPESKISGLRLISNEVFTAYIKKILNYSYKKKRVEGIIWWQAENYYLNNQQLYPNISDEMRKSPQSQNAIFNNYWKILHTLSAKKVITTNPLTNNQTNNQ